MSVSPIDFASLLCSRLCHDLLSPVGALNNGLELLGDENDPEMRTRVFQLLSESARVSANKLKFFRLAFGAAGGFGEQVDAREAKTAIEGLLADNKRTQFNWWVETETLPKSALKVMLNLALIASEALVRGGTLDVGGEDNGGQLEIVVKIEGPRIILDPELRRTLTDGEGAEGVTPRAAAAYLVHTLAAQAGGTVLVSEPAENVMIFGVAFPNG
ncbi:MULTISPECIES: histidine phosphotransferase family protein [Sphingomonas]|uniref:Histidine phosphotransferase n=2 Tax=Pseudomonadota TaxID=1224 RepID=A0A0L8AGI4_9GAMM|nr:MULTISPECIES: histidine phosphotransferase family protein [Sphingomonas]KOF01245.1 histidine phosphotransferase [Stenotrophomonas geniculata N1]ANC87621.1 histidine phosphotransferase [Sphingomonas sp. NIC1]MBB3874692.1 histidine phosphotransferase ChpT [Sphingomonas aquatilis]MCI4654308.1 histidine phosphotransferase family protein [Sphingomonas aquatilis]GEM73519.1 histidine phosphotransferase [Sphingomonas aquatilis NBRC 16722]